MPGQFQRAGKSLAVWFGPPLQPPLSALDQPYTLQARHLLRSHLILLTMPTSATPTFHPLFRTRTSTPTSNISPSHTHSGNLCKRTLLLPPQLRCKPAHLPLLAFLKRSLPRLRPRTACTPTMWCISKNKRTWTPSSQSCRNVWPTVAVATQMRLQYPQQVDKS